MSKINHIDSIKENPEILSQLPEKAKIEINDFLNFIFFKYKIGKTSLLHKKKRRFVSFKENPIKTDSFKMYSRNELHER